MSLRTRILASLFFTSLGLSASADEPGQKKEMTVAASKADEKALTQIAILLDTSGSMKGLIDQARCQLWNAVSELATASKDGSPVNLEIAVYQYGSGSIPAEQGYLRQVIGFTDNLDEVSRALFSLTVGGSKEFCSQTINHALDELEWSSSPTDYRAVFIAGNESFDQGKVDFGEALPKALSKEILINSIYCLQSKEKVAPSQWVSAAQLAKGLPFEINHNHHLPEMKTPYDAKMRELNKEMNETFVWYGEGGEKAAKNQKMQDANMAKMSDHAFAARMSAKIGHLYHHAHSDLIDALDHGLVKLDKMPVAKMPEHLRAMSTEQRMAYLEKKIADRQKVRRQMADDISKRHAFVQRKMSEMTGAKNSQMMVLGDALVRAVRQQAMARGFQFEENRTAKVTK